jgi:hypothetical protein
MKYWAALFAVLVFCGSVHAQKTRPVETMPTGFELGRETFFDFGPPFNYYEVFIVRDALGAASVERITLSPAADRCTLSPKLEVTRGSLNQSVGSLLNQNPCAIPDSALHRELKRRKKGLVFSGANVTMRVQCGSEQRFIKSAILDRDMFDPRANTPEHTLWTMRLLARLDDGLGSGVMEKPMFPLLSPDEQQVSAEQLGSVTAQQIAAGSYDLLFDHAPEKLSDLYGAARNPPAFVPVIALQSSFPLWPELFVPPVYPSLAKMTRVRAPITFTVDVNEEGIPSNLVFVHGHRLLEGAVRVAVAQWRFPKNMIGLQVTGTIMFSFKCPSDGDPKQTMSSSTGFAFARPAISLH